MLREKCDFPSCREWALFTPAVELPTIRSKGMSNDLVKTDKPTTILLPGVCLKHQQRYILRNWFDPNTWRQLQEFARIHGYEIVDIDIITVQFKPLGWTPQGGLEVQR